MHGQQLLRVFGRSLSLGPGANFILRVLNMPCPVHPRRERAVDVPLVLRMLRQDSSHEAHSSTNITTPET